MNLITIKSSISQAARAGFYNTNIPGEIDGVRCFCCFKELDGFQHDEDPWIEHQKHNNDCEFVRLGKPEYQQTMEEFVKIVMERQINIIVSRFIIIILIIIILN